MRKAIVMLSAAVVLAGFASASVATAAPAAKFRLPPPTAPKNQIYAPAAIARDLEKRGYRIEKMKRKGTTYSITALGPHQNKVQMTVDGRSGDVVGLAVLQAAANLAGAIAAIVKSGKGSRYVDDSHPFGIIIPDTYQTRWTSITSWTTYSTQYVSESWSGAGYRFAVPFNSVRPGYNGMSVTTFDASDSREPIYDVYDYDGTELATDYSDASYEISASESFEASYDAQDEQLEGSYLDGTIDEQEDVDVDEVADYDSEDGDYDIGDDGSDDYDADMDDGGDGDDDPGDVDDGGDDGDDGGDDDGGDEPDMRIAV